MSGCFKQPTLALVTGASRGYGEAVAAAIAKELLPDNGSQLWLLGRNIAPLQETRNKLLDQLKVIHPDKTVDGMIQFSANFECTAMSDVNLGTTLRNILPGAGSFSQLLVVHNAGTIGDPSKSCVQIPYSEASQYMDINVAAIIALNSQLHSMYDTIEKRTVVQISSLCGIKPVQSLALYCSGKAARDMYFKVYAAENPEVHVLNWAPGPMDTDMYRTVRDTSNDSSVAELFRNMKLLTSQESADRLIKVIISDEYESGVHLDFNDVQ